MSGHRRIGRPGGRGAGMAPQSAVEAPSWLAPEEREICERILAELGPEWFGNKVQVVQAAMMARALWRADNAHAQLREHRADAELAGKWGTNARAEEAAVASWMTKVRLTHQATTSDRKVLPGSKGPKPWEPLPHEQ